MKALAKNASKHHTAVNKVQSKTMGTAVMCIELNDHISPYL